LEKPGKWTSSCNLEPKVEKVAKDKMKVNIMVVFVWFQKIKNDKKSSYRCKQSILKIQKILGMTNNMRALEFVVVAKRFSLGKMELSMIQWFLSCFWNETMDKKKH
jgi:hypothetical protein